MLYKIKIIEIVTMWLEYISNKEIQTCHLILFWKQRGTKEPLDEGERGEWKAGLKLNIQKTQNMTSGPITSRQIDEEKVETVTDLFSWAPKSLWTVTAAMRLKDTCSLEANL